MSSRQAEFKVLGRNNGGAKIVVGKFEDYLTGANKGIEDALGYKLFIISGPLMSVSNTVDDAENRGCGECLLP